MTLHLGVTSIISKEGRNCKNFFKQAEKMTSEMNSQQRIECPSCGKKAKRVSSVTLAALLSEEFAQQFQRDENTCCDSNEEGCTSLKENTGWRFCNSQDCEVVYFSELDQTVFKKSQLKVAVGVKETAGERPLCYCFGHSVASIKEELKTKGHCDAPQIIRTKMKNPGCRCETENPSGSCCLGNITNGIQIAKDELGMKETGTHISVKPSGIKGENIAKVGTIISSIMASSCCWLPLLLLAVGVSGAGIASTLEAYRPLLMGVTFVFLAAAFYYTYRPKRNNDGHGCCASEPAGGEDCCAPAGKGKFNMICLNKVMLWGVTVMAVVFLLFPSYVGAIIGGDGKSVTENTNNAVFKIDGMSCEGCSATVATVIRSVPQVQAVEVSYEKGEAVVGSDICCPVPVDEIQTALSKAGYTGILIKPANRNNSVGSTGETD